MKNLTFCLLGLVSIPACLSIKPKGKHCFSESLNPSYPCCQGDKIVYTDDDGDWGVENNEWCGIGGIEEPDESCFSIKLGYPCCKEDKIIFSDERGDWGKEDKQWCGIGNGPVEEPIETPTDETPEETSIIETPTEESPEETFIIEIPTEESPEETSIIETPTEETPTPFLNPDLPCNSMIEGYPCCRTTCEAIYTDSTGSWNIENGNWCGILNSCFQPVIKPIINMTAEIAKIENSDDYIVESNNQFEFTFLKLENNKKNMIYSPLSIEYALKMLLEGAEGKTYDEIIEVLGEIEIPKYDNVDKNLSLANGLFIKEKYYEYVKASYMELLQAKYNAEVIEDEFKDAKNINQWIEDKTLGIIKNMISDQTVQDDDNAMFLINALAIDMEWEDHFNDRNTIGSPFYKDNGEEIMATTMTKHEVITPNISFYLDDEITVLTMLLQKYNETQLEFMAIMPKENLSDYVENITKAHINVIDKYLIKGNANRNGVNVKIPKFKFNYNLGLKKGLQELGVNETFKRGIANFKKMSDAEELEDLFVSDALHKADIEFSEDGIKAAAVTVIVMGGPAAFLPEIKIPVDIIIDKPFMFLIRDVKTKDIWFTGTVYEPNLWENDKAKYDRK